MPETRWGDRHVPVARDPVEGMAERQAEIDDKNEPSCEEIAHPAIESPNEHEIVIKLTGKPSMAQFSLLGRLDKAGAKGIIPALIMPFRLFAFPVVLWSSFSFAWAASMLVIINVTQSQAFAGPPWDMSATDVGYTNFGALVGVALSLVVAGPLSDKVSAFFTRRNKGIREPEMRLVALAPFVVSCLLGGVLIAIGYQHHWSWAAIVVAGYGLLGFVLPAISAISLTYAVSSSARGPFLGSKLTTFPFPQIDSYKPVAGEILVAATMIKNLWAYGMTKYFNNWIASAGYIPPIMFNTSLAVFIFLLAMPLFYIGKRFRGWTRNSVAHREIE